QAKREPFQEGLESDQRAAEAHRAMPAVAVDGKPPSGAPMQPQADLRLRIQTGNEEPRSAPRGHQRPIARLRRGSAFHGAGEPQLRGRALRDRVSDIHAHQRARTYPGAPALAKEDRSPGDSDRG